jgi:indole-3-acetate monooxygenase
VMTEATGKGGRWSGDSRPTDAERGAVRSSAQRTGDDSQQLAGGRIKGIRKLRLQYRRQVRSTGHSFPLTDLFMGKATTGGAAFRLGTPAWVAAFHIGIALGIARRALDEISAQALEKSRGFPPSALPTQPYVQFALGKAEIELAAARAYGIQLTANLYEETQDGQTPSPARQAEARAASTYLTEIAQRATMAAFQSVGGTALFESNPLQRCFRDIAAAAQHFAVTQSAYRTLGQFKLNPPDANPML